MEWNRMEHYRESLGALSERRRYKPNGDRGLCLHVVLRRY